MNFDNHPDAADLARLRKLAQKMDSAFRLPVIGVRVGWDSIIGLVPVVGDTLALVPSVFILRESRRLGAPRTLIAHMMVNTGIDFALGSIPLVGDVFDIGWRSKTRNVDLLHKHLANKAKVQPAPDSLANEV
ncbi:MAG: DUF4112 domain-containing protein [Sulfitobacter sp.]